MTAVATTPNATVEAGATLVEIEPADTDETGA